MIKKIIEKLKNLFRKKQKPTTTNVQPSKKLENEKPLKRIAIALIVGHDAKKQGAVNYDGLSEFNFNRDLVFNRIDLTSLKERAKRDGYYLEIHRIIKDPSLTYGKAAEKVKQYIAKHQIKLALELHFNSCDNKAVSGTEILIIQERRNTWFDRFVYDFGLEIADKFDLRYRGVKHIESFNQRGGGVLYRLDSVNCLTAIVEPAFGYDERFFTNPNLYARIIENNLLKSLKNLK